MDLSRWLSLAIVCCAGQARGDAPPIEGHVAVGVRASTTESSAFDFPADNTPLGRPTVDALVGHRVGHLVLGVRAAITPTPLRYLTKPDYPATYSKIYPLDIGVGAELTARSGFWGTAWVGATVAFTHAQSPAAHIEATDFMGDIPAASWSDRTTSVGFGIGCGYDVVVTRHGRLGPVFAFDYEGIGKIPVRRNNGDTDLPAGDATSVSFAVALAYRY